MWPASCFGGWAGADHCFDEPEEPASPTMTAANPLTMVTMVWTNVAFQTRRWVCRACAKSALNVETRTINALENLLPVSFPIDRRPVSHWYVSILPLHNRAKQRFRKDRYDMDAGEWGWLIDPIIPLEMIVETRFSDFIKVVRLLVMFRCQLLHIDRLMDASSSEAQ